MLGLGKNDVWPLVKDSFIDWMDDKATKLAAALSYYTVISLAPLVVILFKVVSYIYRDHPKDTIEAQVNSLTGGVGGDLVRQILDSSSKPGAGVIATIISAVVLLFGASGVFGELQDSLNTIWEVKPKPNRGIVQTIKDRFMSLSMVLGIAFLLVLSASLSTAIGFVTGFLTDNTVGDRSIIATVAGYAVDLVVSSAVVTVLFAAIFKLLPDVEITWRDVWTGAILTAILFQIGKYGLTIYFHFSSTASAYGAAGSLIALLVWLYYSSQILFFGAEVTQVYSRKFGSGIEPAANAVPVTATERANRGMTGSAREPQRPPRPVRIPPPIKREIARPAAVGGAGVAAGLLVGLIGAWAYVRRNVTTDKHVATKDAEFNHRLDAVEQRIRRLRELRAVTRKPIVRRELVAVE
jgi:membrane protein